MKSEVLSGHDMLQSTRITDAMPQSTILPFPLRNQIRNQHLIFDLIHPLTRVKPRSMPEWRAKSWRDMNIHITHTVPKSLVSAVVFTSPIVRLPIPLSLTSGSRSNGLLSLAVRTRGRGSRVLCASLRQVSRASAILDIHRSM